MYDILFDISAREAHVPANLWVPGTAVVVFFLINAAVSSRKRWLFLLFAALASLIVVFGAAGYYQRFERLRSMALNGDYDVVEGRVMNFVADLPTANRPQEFEVSGQGFVIWRESTPSFNDTVGQGGPNLARQCVAVRFVDERTIWLARVRGGCENRVRPS